MPLRLLRYMLRIWDALPPQQPHHQKLPPILPVVFYQGHKPWPFSPKFADLVDLPEQPSEDLQACIPQFTHNILNLAEMDLDTVNQHLLVKVSLGVMRAILNPDPKRSLQEGIRVLKDLAGASDAAAFFRIALTYLVNAGNSVDAQLFVEQIQSLHNPRLENEAMTIADSLIQKGRQEGRQEGRQQGRQEGLISGERLLLERLLNRRFGPLPANLKNRLNQATAHHLETWSDRVLFAASLDEIFGD